MQDLDTGSYNVAEAKKHLSELLGRVAFGGESILITRRGRPMARLVPVERPLAVSLAEVRGWLDDDDPFFDAVDEVVGSRGQRGRDRRRAVDLADVDGP